MGTSSRQPASAKPSPEAFQEIAKEHRKFLVKYLGLLGLDESDAEDVVQEVLHGAYRALDRFDPARGTMRAWLIAIATNQASNHRRRAYRRHERPAGGDQLEDVPDDAPDSEEHAIAFSRCEVLNELLEEIPIERRIVLIAHDIFELELTAIAAAFSIPLATAKTRYRLARRDLDAARRRWQARQRTRGLDTEPLVPLLLQGEGGWDALVRGREHFQSWMRSLARDVLANARGLCARSLQGAAAKTLVGAAVSTGVAIGLLGRLPEAASWSAARTRLAPAAAAAPAERQAPALIQPDAPEATAQQPLGAPAPTGRASATAPPPTVIGRTGAWSTSTKSTAEDKLIERAGAAIAAGQYRVALDMLQQHARQFPSGVRAAQRERYLRAVHNEGIR